MCVVSPISPPNQWEVLDQVLSEKLLSLNQRGGNFILKFDSVFPVADDIYGEIKADPKHYILFQFLLSKITF